MHFPKKALLKISLDRNECSLIYIFYNNEKLIFRLEEPPTNIIREVHYPPQLRGDLFSQGRTYVVDQYARTSFKFRN